MVLQEKTMKHQKQKLATLLAVIVLVSLACGQFSVGVEDQNPPSNNTSDNAGNNTAEETPGDTGAQQEPTPEPVGAQYWVEVQHPYHGFRFAVPCFWTVQFPTYLDREDDGRGAYHAFNYPEDYPQSFPRSVIPPENGALKIDFLPISLPFNGLPNEISLEEYIAWEEGQYVPDDTTELVSIEEVTLNGTQAVSVVMQNTESEQAYRYYLLRISPEFLMRIYVYPSSKIFNTPDLQGILNSITIDPQAEVSLPGHIPAAPPIGLAAPCIPEYAVAVEPTVEIPEENTTCGLHSFKSLDYLTESVTEMLQQRNTGGLRWGYFITDPFTYREWESEAETISADQFASKLPNELYPEGDLEPDWVTFTNDRSQFPLQEGVAPEGYLGFGIPIVEILFSEGWGEDGLGTALLYFAQDECGGYYWYGLAYSRGHFDQ
jgi:hypothetical protein